MSLADAQSRQTALRAWQRGWSCTFDTHSYIQAESGRRFEGYKGKPRGIAFEAKQMAFNIASSPVEFSSI
jgi:hypothetical protein